MTICELVEKAKDPLSSKSAASIWMNGYGTREGVHEGNTPQHTWKLNTNDPITQLKLLKEGIKEDKNIDLIDSTIASLRSLRINDYVPELINIDGLANEVLGYFTGLFPQKNYFDGADKKLIMIQEFDIESSDVYAVKPVISSLVLGMLGVSYHQSKDGAFLFSTRQMDRQYFMELSFLSRNRNSIVELKKQFDKGTQFSYLSQIFQKAYKGTIKLDPNLSTSDVEKPVLLTATFDVRNPSN